MHTPKFGASNRKLVDKATEAKRAKYECPTCRKKMVERKGNSVWKCKSCGSEYAGASYTLTSEAGEIAKRLISEYSES